MASRSSRSSRASKADESSEEPAIRKSARAIARKVGAIVNKKAPLSPPRQSQNTNTQKEFKLPRSRPTVPQSSKSRNSAHFPLSSDVNIKPKINPNPLGPDDEHDPNQLFCICKQPYDPRRFMIGCDNCDGWFHARCVNVTVTEAHRLKKFLCPPCRRVRRTASSSAEPNRSGDEESPARRQGSPSSILKRRRTNRSPSPDQPPSPPSSSPTGDSQRSRPVGDRSMIRRGDKSRRAGKRPLENDMISSQSLPKKQILQQGSLGLNKKQRKPMTSGNNSTSSTFNSGGTSQTGPLRRAGQDIMLVFQSDLDEEDDSESSESHDDSSSVFITSDEEGDELAFLEEPPENEEALDRHSDSKTTDPAEDPTWWNRLAWPGYWKSPIEAGGVQESRKSRSNPMFSPATIALQRLKASCVRELLEQEKLKSNGTEPVNDSDGEEELRSQGSNTTLNQRSPLSAPPVLADPLSPNPARVKSPQPMQSSPSRRSPSPVPGSPVHLMSSPRETQSPSNTEGDVGSGNPHTAPPSTSVSSIRTNASASPSGTQQLAQQPTLEELEQQLMSGVERRERKLQEERARLSLHKCVYESALAFQVRSSLMGEKITVLAPTAESPLLVGAFNNRQQRQTSGQSNQASEPASPADTSMGGSADQNNSHPRTPFTPTAKPVAQDPRSQALNAVEVLTCRACLGHIPYWLFADHVAECAKELGTRDPYKAGVGFLCQARTDVCSCPLQKSRWPSGFATELEASSEDSPGDGSGKTKSIKPRGTNVRKKLINDEEGAQPEDDANVTRSDEEEEPKETKVEELEENGEKIKQGGNKGKEKEKQKEKEKEKEKGRGSGKPNEVPSTSGNPSKPSTSPEPGQRPTGAGEDEDPDEFCNVQADQCKKHGGWKAKWKRCCLRLELSMERRAKFVAQEADFLRARSLSRTSAPERVAASTSAMASIGGVKLDGRGAVGVVSGSNSNNININNSVVSGSGSSRSAATSGSQNVIDGGSNGINTVNSHNSQANQTHGLTSSHPHASSSTSTSSSSSSHSHASGQHHHSDANHAREGEGMSHSLSPRGYGMIGPGSMVPVPGGVGVVPGPAYYPAMMNPSFLPPAHLTSSHHLSMQGNHPLPPNQSARYSSYMHPMGVATAPFYMPQYPSSRVGAPAHLMMYGAGGTHAYPGTVPMGIPVPPVLPSGAASISMFPPEGQAPPFM